MDTTDPTDPTDPTDVWPVDSAPTLARIPADEWTDAIRAFVTASSAYWLTELAARHRKVTIPPPDRHAAHLAYLDGFRAVVALMDRWQVTRRDRGHFADYPAALTRRSYRGEPWPRDLLEKGRARH